MKTPYIVGEKIYLRPLEREDAAVIQPWINDSDVTRNLLVWRPMALQDEIDFVERAALGIALKDSDRLIGTTGLFQIDWKNRRAAFGIEIGVKTDWGKGYGGETTRLVVGHAFETMNLHRVWLMVYEFNTRGLRCTSAWASSARGCCASTTTATAATGTRSPWASCEKNGSRPNGSRIGERVHALHSGLKSVPN